MRAGALADVLDALADFAERVIPAIAAEPEAGLWPVREVVLIER